MVNPRFCDANSAKARRLRRCASALARGRSNRRGSVCSTSRFFPTWSRSHRPDPWRPHPTWRSGPDQPPLSARCGPAHFRQSVLQV